MTNRLAAESSPYLLQHAENPVDWYAWGTEALSAAQLSQKPIFLSIGYSACHWCHVMEHESFENPEIAAILNEHFISIKVDREERPDLDQIYMQAVQMLTGRGGWPMSVFLTPAGKPFYGGTYWPPRGRMGMPGFDQVLLAVLDAWQNRRQDADQQAEMLTGHIRQLSSVEPEADAADQIHEQLLAQAAARLEQSFDFTHGGFGGAPKFPHPIDLQLLLRVYQRLGNPVHLEMVELNLAKMAQGGIFDHLGGGFARYSVDARWLVPHFEKMLYDNAQLATAYLEAYQVTQKPELATVARATLDYVLCDLTDAQGGFHSTEDADSEGEEGKFYVWSPDEIRQVLREAFGAEQGQRLAEQFCYVYDVTEGGNFEGHSILNRVHTWEEIERLKSWPQQELQQAMALAREQLLAARARRVRPGKDDKVLVSWNGLMIHALALAANTLHEPRYLQAAQRAAQFIHDEMWQASTGLQHTWRHGTAKLNAYLDDYACLIQSLVTLYQADWDEKWLSWAIELADRLLQRFEDPAGGGFFFTADDHEQLITRTQDWMDSSVPSGNGMAATALIRLGRVTGRRTYLLAAERTLERGVSILRERSPAAAQLLVAADMLLGPAQEVVVRADRSQPAVQQFLSDRYRHFLPRVEVACRPLEDSTQGPLDEIFADKRALTDSATIYMCSHFTCAAPLVGLTDAADLWQQLE